MNRTRKRIEVRHGDVAGKEGKEEENEGEKGQEIEIVKKLAKRKIVKWKRRKRTKIMIAHLPVRQFQEGREVLRPFHESKLWGHF